MTRRPLASCRPQGHAQGRAPRGAEAAGVLRRFVRGTRGAAAVEFALVVPVLLTLVCAIIDFGRLFFVSASLTAAVRDGARAAAVLPNPLDATQVASVQQRVVAGFQGLGSVAITSGNVTVTTDAPSNGGVVTIVTVRVQNYAFRPITPFASAFGLGTVNLSRTAVFRWERSS